MEIISSLFLIPIASFFKTRNQLEVKFCRSLLVITYLRLVDAWDDIDLGDGVVMSFSDCKLAFLEESSDLVKLYNCS